MVDTSDDSNSFGGSLDGNYKQSLLLLLLDVKIFDDGS